MPMGYEMLHLSHSLLESFGRLRLVLRVLIQRIEELAGNRICNAGGRRGDAGRREDALRKDPGQQMKNRQ